MNDHFPIFLLYRVWGPFFFVGEGEELLLKGKRGGGRVRSDKGCHVRFFLVFPECMLKTFVLLGMGGMGP